DLFRQTVTPIVSDGWLRINESTGSPIALNGFISMESRTGATAVPLQTSPSDHVLFSRTLNDQDLDSQLSLVTGDSAASVTIALNRADGATLGQSVKPIAANSKLLVSLRELFPSIAKLGTFVTVRSSSPLYAVEVVVSSQVLAAVTPEQLPTAYAPPAMSPK